MSGVSCHQKQPRRTRRREHKPEVDGLNMIKIQSTIQWRGIVHLSQLNEGSESLLSEIEWPKKSGNHYFVCASTGLLFDKQTGACRQSSTVELKTETVEKVSFTAAAFKKWVSDRMTGDWAKYAIKPGPKAGSRRVSCDELPEDEDATME